MEKSAGVLLHITSLYDQYGCETFGSHAYHFIDLLKKSGFVYWQILLFSIADNDNSPYTSLKKHTCLTSVYGLDDVHKYYAKVMNDDLKDVETYKYDFMQSDNMYDDLTSIGYKISFIDDKTN